MAQIYKPTATLARENNKTYKLFLTNQENDNVLNQYPNFSHKKKIDKSIF
jgi:hypothetical protein